MAKKNSGKRLPLSKWRSLMQKVENELVKERAENRDKKKKVIEKVNNETV